MCIIDTFCFFVYSYVYEKIHNLFENLLKCSDNVYIKHIKATLVSMITLYSSLFLCTQIAFITLYPGLPLYSNCI